MGLLLQIAHESGRTFIPPLTATVLEENAGRTRSTEKYVFYVFRGSWSASLGSCTTRWTTSRLKGSFPDRLEATRLVKELQEPLTLDVREMVSLEEMVHGLTRP
ncbi:hypothetical protein JCM10213_003401, partial [Rhodosporidiobolus nylandii]